MCLEGGQANERGYAMAALLVSLAVMMVLMSVAMPVWKTQMQREKEAELIFRGEQIARGINLYMRKMGGASYPPSLDILVQNHFLRKKYKDPMTENDMSLPMNQRGEWDLITAAGGVPGGGEGGPSPQQPGGRGRAGAPATGLSAPPSRAGSPSASATPSFGGQAAGGLMGVRSKSKESSFKIYKGTGTHYNEWMFLFSTVSNRPGVPGGGQAVPGMPMRGNPGQRGAPVPGPGMGPGPGRGPRGFGPGSVQPGIRGGGRG